MAELIHLLTTSSNIVSNHFYQTNKRLFIEEHLFHLANKLEQYQSNGANRESSPFFQEECTPSLQYAYAFFEKPMNDWKTKLNSADELAIEFSKAIESANIDNILLLMGQRLTPASIRDHRAIPPLRKTLINAASQIYEGSLMVAAREWSKHTNRSPDFYWGKIEGGNEYKNKKAIEIIEHILSNATWWNVFYHFKHEIVFESRIASGQGVRWANDGSKLIGFLEPFI